MTDHATTRDDPLWQRIRREVEEDARREPTLASFLYAVVLNHPRLEDALSFILASKLGSTTVPAITLRDLVTRPSPPTPRSGSRCAPIWRRW